MVKFSGILDKILMRNRCKQQENWCE